MININNVCFYLLEKSRTKIKKHMKVIAFNESYYLTEDDKKPWWVSPSEKGTAEGNFGGNYEPDSTPEQRRDAWNKSGRSSPGYNFNVKNTANWGAGVDIDNAKQPPTSTTTEEEPEDTTSDSYNINKMRGSLEEPEDTTEEPSSYTPSKPSIPQPPPSFIEDDGINVKGVTDKLNGGTSLITPEILAPPKSSSSVNSTPSIPSVPQPPPSTSTSTPSSGREMSKSSDFRRFIPQFSNFNYIPPPSTSTPPPSTSTPSPSSTSTPSPSTANSSSSTNVAAAETNISGIPNIKIPKELTNTLAAMGIQKPQDSGIDDEGNVDLTKLLTKGSNISPNRLLNTSLNDTNNSEGSPNQRRSRDPYQT